MKFLLFAFDHDFSEGRKTGVINGGTAVLQHFAHTLESMGHEAKMMPLRPFYEQADVIIVQSEWYSTLQEYFARERAGGTKIVVWLGHFIGGNYFDPKLIQADYFFTTWQGDILASIPFETLYLPHAFCDICDQDTEVEHTNTIFFGNTYALRDEGWLAGIPVDRFYGMVPAALGSYYRRAKVCANIHGDFQKGIVSTHNSTLADLPGYAVNERLFAICGSGGFQVCDNSPLINSIYPDDEIIKCDTKKQFQEAIIYFLQHPNERLPFIEKAKAHTLAEHTYKHRMEKLLNYITK